MTKKSSPTGSGHSKIMHYGMMVCCAVMLLPIAGYFVAGGTIGGLWGKSAVFRDAQDDGEILSWGFGGRRDDKSDSVTHGPTNGKTPTPRGVNWPAVVALFV